MHTYIQALMITCLMMFMPSTGALAQEDTTRKEVAEKVLKQSEEDAKKRCDGEFANMLACKQACLVPQNLTAPGSSVIGPGSVVEVPQQKSGGSSETVVIPSVPTPQAGYVMYCQAECEKCCARRCQ
jgi:hypothetical protein